MVENDNDAAIKFYIGVFIAVITGYVVLWKNEKEIAIIVTAVLGVLIVCCIAFLVYQYRLEQELNPDFATTTTWRPPGSQNATNYPEIEVSPMTKQTANDAPAQTASAPPTETASAPQLSATENSQVKVVVLPGWWEACMDANGKVYYKNNYNKTTSWTPPTPEQIVRETQERQAQGVGSPDNFGSAPDNLPPPAYEE